MNLAAVDTSNHRPQASGYELDEADRARLKQACSDLESLFLSELMKNMRRTIPESDLLPQSAGHDIYESMFDRQVAVSLSGSRGGLGLGKMIYEQMSGARLGTPAAAGHEVSGLSETAEQTQDLDAAKTEIKPLRGQSPKGMILEYTNSSRRSGSAGADSDRTTAGGDHDAP